MTDASTPIRARRLARLASGSGVALTLLSHTPAMAQEPALTTRAGPWTLLNPTPRELMRPLSTDRPDTTESPYTVDAGHVQIEMSVIEYGRDDGNDSYSYAPINLKIGILEHVDLQFLFEPYLREQGDEGTHGGVGASGLRAKFNLFGNDGGPTALALMPFVIFPTGDDDVSASEVEFGLIVPLALELNERLGLGLMAQFDYLTDDEGGREFVFVHTSVLGYDLTDSIGVFLEYIGEVGSDEFSEYAASVSTGLTHGTGPDVQLDLGITAGLNEAAEDFAVFTGITLRF